MSRTNTFQRTIGRSESIVRVRVNKVVGTWIKSLSGGGGEFDNYRSTNNRNIDYSR